MAKNKNGGGASGDDIEPMWVSPDNAEDDWDDDFSASSVMDDEGTDDFDGRPSEADADDRAAYATSQNDDFDDFDGGFDAEAGGDDYDDVGLDEDAPQPATGKRKSAFAAASGGGNKNTMFYAVAGVVGLGIVYMGYNMVLGGKKQNVPQPPANIVKAEPPKPQPVAGITPVDLQQTPGAIPTAVDVAQGTKNEAPLPVAQPIGTAPLPGAGGGADIATDLATLATAPPAPAPTATSQAPDVPLPTGIAGETAVPMIMNNGVPTLPVGADAVALAKSGGPPKAEMSEDQVTQLGDKLLAEFRTDMELFKKDMNRSVKETIQDDMALLRVQVEGLNRRVDTMEKGQDIPALQDTVKPQVQEQTTDNFDARMSDVSKDEPMPAQDKPPKPVDIARVAAEVPDVPDVPVAPPVAAAADMRAKTPEPAVVSAATDKMGDAEKLKPIEPIKIKKPVAKSEKTVVTARKKAKQDSDVAAAQDHASVKDLRSGLPMGKQKKDPAAPSSFQKMAESASVQAYELRGVSAGTAWVAAAGSGTIMTISRGDFLPGMGRVTEIRRGFSGWEVITEKGTLRQ